jgi:uracil-DNA glycosylase
MPATDDEIREKYLERAIRELNQLTHELQDCELCPRGQLMPVLGSGHPQADVFLLKYAPTGSEIECRGRVLEELAIVQPRIVVVMGEEALRELNDLDVPLGRPVEARPGEIQKLTPTCDALYVPDIDQALDNDAAKREFWAAFRALGDWYAELPPY